MRSMVEGCYRSPFSPTSPTATPLRQACGLPPPLAGEDESRLDQP